MVVRVLVRQNIVSPRGFRETVIDQKLFPSGVLRNCHGPKSFRRTKHFPPRGFREAIADQNIFPSDVLRNCHGPKPSFPSGVSRTFAGQKHIPLGGFMKLSQTKKHFPPRGFRETFMTRCVILTLVPLFGDLQKKKIRAQTGTIGGREGKNKKLK